MERSPAPAECLLELYLEEPVCILILFTIFTCFISKVQMILPTSCKDCNSRPVAKSIANRKISKTLNKHKDDGTELTHEDVEDVMSKIGFTFDQGRTMVGSDSMLELFANDEPSLHEVKQAFCVFDEDNDGYADALDLCRVLRNLGLREGVEVNECEQMIAKYDMNKDRRIDMIEFTRILEASFC